MLYPTWPTVTRTRITISDVAEQCSAAPLVNIGEASHDLHLVLQGSVVVWRVQGQHPILTKDDWGSIALVYYICPAFEVIVPPTTDSRCPHLSIPLG